MKIRQANKILSNDLQYRGSTLRRAKRASTKKGNNLLRILRRGGRAALWFAEQIQGLPDDYLQRLRAVFGKTEA